MTGQTMVDPAQRPSPPPARRGFLASLLMLLGLRPSAVPAAPTVPPSPVTMVERDGWLLDEKDR
jgi:hypothetical protein